MTLTINSLLAGPFLRKLGLADSSEVRLRIVKSYTLRYRAAMIDEMVRLLCQNRFRRVNFALVKQLVPALADLTKSQLLYAVAANKAITSPEDYHPPLLQNVLRHVVDDTSGTHNERFRELEAQILESHANYERNARIAKRVKHRRERQMHRFTSSNLRYMMAENFLSAQELRILFISILKGAYERQIEQGELEDAHVLAVTFDQSLDLALGEVSKGASLTDWEILHSVHQPLINAADRIYNLSVTKVISKLVPAKHGYPAQITRSFDALIDRSLCFMAAHRSAQNSFTAELQDADNELTEAAKVILGESEQQYRLAEDYLRRFDEKVLELAITHKFCKILLNIGVIHILKLVSLGMMKETEAEPMVEEIEERIHHINAHHISTLVSDESEEHKASSFFGNDGAGFDYEISHNEVLSGDTKTIESNPYGNHETGATHSDG
jgi:hypothetical protein